MSIIGSDRSEDFAPKPTPGRVVWYQTDGRNFDYYVPAFVVITKDNLVEEAREQGLIEGLDSEWHVHLWTPGGRDPYHEYNVPFDPDGSPRSWRWPERRS